MFEDGSVDPEGHAFEPPEGSDDGTGANPECDTLGCESDAARSEDEVVEHMSEHQDSEIEGWELRRIDWSM